MPGLTKVATKAEIPAGTGKVVEAGGRSVAVFNCGGVFYAIDGTCVHRGGPLGEGSLAGTTVTCPWHGWEYDVTSGQCGTNSSAKVAVVPLQLEGEDILISL